MNFTLKQAHSTEIEIAFDLLKSASKTLVKKNIKQWYYWQNPPKDKVQWVKEGFAKKEFYFIKNSNANIMGMVRILEEDLTYWGKMPDRAKYIHSLVIHEDFSGNQLGTKVVNYIEKDAIANHFNFLRLDCDATNHKLCAYYEKQGFLNVGQKQLPLGVYNLYQKELG